MVNTLTRFYITHHLYALGDVIYIQIPKQSIIILGSARAATDLLEKRSDIYSDRPKIVMHEL